MAEKDRHVLKAILRSATPYLSVNASVLDVGCASGTLLEELRERGHKALAGVDVSEYAVRASKENGFENVYLCNFQDGTQLPDSSYDTLFMLDVIEHFTRPYDALIEATRVLSPGGVLVLTTPNANSILRPLLGKRWALGDETHVFYFTPFSLKYLLGKCGLHVAKLQTRSYNYGPVARVLTALRTAGQIVAIAQKPYSASRVGPSDSRRPPAAEGGVVEAR